MLKAAAQPRSSEAGAAAAEMAEEEEVASRALSYTRIALKRGVTAPQEGIAVPSSLASMAGGEVFHPNRVTVVPAPLAAYLRNTTDLFL